MNLEHESLRRAGAKVSWARLGLGLAMLMAPELAGRVAGMPAPRDSAGRMYRHFWASREITVGGLTLAAMQRGAAGRSVWLLNAVCDGIDTLALLSLARGPDRPTRYLASGIPLGLGVTGAWMLLAATSPD